eukprot:jgi/Mesen1/3798/ME000206S02976
METRERCYVAGIWRTVQEMQDLYTAGLAGVPGVHQINCFFSNVDSTDSQAPREVQQRSARWQQERGPTFAWQPGGASARAQLLAEFDPGAIAAEKESDTAKTEQLQGSRAAVHWPNEWRAGKALQHGSHGPGGTAQPSRLAGETSSDEEQDRAGREEGTTWDDSVAAALRAAHVERRREALVQLPISTSPSGRGAFRKLLQQQDPGAEKGPQEEGGEGGGKAEGANEDKCEGRYIYMYDLPPKFNQELLDNCQHINLFFPRCTHLSNNALGPLMYSLINGCPPGGRPDGLPPIKGLERSVVSSTGEEEEEGAAPGGDNDVGGCWHETEQHTLEQLVHNYMREYACLTKDPERASAFYLPFYPGLDAEKHLFGGASQATEDRLGGELAALLRESPMWQRRGGRDHFFAMGRVTWDFRKGVEGSGWGVPLLAHPEVKSTLRLTMERATHDPREFAVPFPTAFHPRTDRQVETWVAAVRARASPRAWRTSFVGGPRDSKHAVGGIKEAAILRAELMRQCHVAGSPAQCNVLVCSSASTSACEHPASVLEVMLSSDFCLQPRGDCAVRRSTFDSLVAGCIPVFFDPKSAYEQYLWHLPPDPDSYSVFIPAEAVVNRSASVVAVLGGYSRERIARMRETILGLIPGLLYSKGRLRAHEDAMDISVRMLLRHIRRLKDGLERW